MAVEWEDERTLPVNTINDLEDLILARLNENKPSFLHLPVLFTKIDLWIVRLVKKVFP